MTPREFLSFALGAVVAAGIAAATRGDWLWAGLCAGCAVACIQRLAGRTS